MQVQAYLTSAYFGQSILECGCPPLETLVRKQLRVNILLMPVGSSGDVHPFVGLGVILVGRGHRVTVITNEYFRPLVERVGLHFVPLGTVEQFHELANHPDLWHPRRGFFYIAKNGIIPFMRPQFDKIAELNQPGKTVVVSSCLGFGARLAQDVLGIPLATIHLQPAVFLSVHSPPRLAPVFSPSWLPRSVIGLQYQLGETLLLDPALRPATNALRQELGLSPIRHVVTQWWHSPQMVIGLFPSWYAGIQPDWPANTYLTDFPLWDERGVTSVPKELDAFLAENPSPIVFTPGSAMRLGNRFFASAAKATEMLGRSAILLTRFPDQIPGTLPATVKHFDFIPFSQVLPCASALVHHGGIGSTSQALAAGIPQLIMPMSHDQPDNAMRIRRLGVGEELARHKFTPVRLRDKLDRLLNNPLVKNSCRQLAEKFHPDRGLRQAADLIESLVSPTRQ